MLPQDMTPDQPGNGAMPGGQGGEVSGPPVTILLATYNGAAVLPRQLDSFARQRHRNWQLIVSDDRSQDDTRTVTAGFAARAAALGHRVTCLRGPGTGAADNFLFLLRSMADHAGPDHWVAFSDQDDIWLPERLSRGIAALAREADHPALFCSRTHIFATDIAQTRLSAPRPKPPGFRNALVQNIASGNTILLNSAAARLVQAAAHEVESLVVHDWWLYQLISGAGGRIVHEDEPTLLYRQHGQNQIGANDTRLSQAKRLYQMVRGDFRAWNTVNIAALRASSHRLTPENLALLDTFAQTRDRALPFRLRGLARMGLYRQSRASTIALWVAALMRKL